MKKVLMAEDDFISRKMLLGILKNKADCDIASNGLEVLEAYYCSVEENLSYDVILLDIEMPLMDGLEVLSEIRKDEKKRGVMLGKGIPIIITTSHKQPTLEAFNKGCDDYMMKPIDAQTLIEKIEEKVL